MCKHLPHSELGTAYSAKRNDWRGPTEGCCLSCLSTLQTDSKHRNNELLYTFIHFVGKINTVKVHHFLLYWRRQSASNTSLTMGSRGRGGGFSVVWGFPLLYGRHQRKEAAPTWKWTCGLVHNPCVKIQTKAQILFLHVSLLQDKATVKLNKLKSLKVDHLLILFAECVC